MGLISICAVGTAGVAFLLVFLYQCSRGAKSAIRVHLISPEPPLGDVPAGSRAQKTSTAAPQHTRRAMQVRAKGSAAFRGRMPRLPGHGATATFLHSDRREQ